MSKRTSFTAQEIATDRGPRYVSVRNRDGRTISIATWNGHWIEIDIPEAKDRKCNRTRIAAMNALDAWASTASPR